MVTPAKLALKIPLPIPEFFHLHSRRGRQGRLPATPEEIGHVEAEGQRCHTSPREAKEWLESMIRSSGRWDNHLSIIHIDCQYTTTELLELGRLPQKEGIIQCRKMVRAPVIFDEIGCFLWERLAEMEQGPNFRLEDEERAAEYMRDMRTKMTLANLDERFRFDIPKYASPDGTGRGRKDSEPISPTHVRQQLPKEDEWQEATPQRRPSHSPQAGYFCRCGGAYELSGVPDDIRNDSLNATRGRVVSSQKQRGTEYRDQKRGSMPTIPVQTPPAGLHNPRRINSYTSTVLWQRDYASTADSSRSASRRGSITDKVAHVMEALGKSVGSMLGDSLSHGYGYAGPSVRTGSVWTI